MRNLIKFINELILPTSTLALGLLKEFKYYYSQTNKNDIVINILKIETFISPNDLENHIALEALEILIYLDSIKVRLDKNLYLQELISRQKELCDYEFIFDRFIQFKVYNLKLSQYVTLGYRNDNGFEIILAEI